MDNTVFNQVIVLFFVMLVGVYAKKRNIITDIVGKKLSELLLHVTMPLLIITSFQMDYSQEMIANAAIVFAVSIGIFAFSAIIGLFLYRNYPPRSRSVLKFVTVFSNCGFMGFPVLERLYGQEGIFYGAIYNITFNIFLWSYGVILFESGDKMKNLKRAVLNPGIISVFIGLFLFVFSIRIYPPMLEAMSMIGSLTTPISMLVIGALVGSVSLKSFFSSFSVYYAVFIRTIAIPLISLFILKLIGVDKTLVGINIVLTAMPAAANTAIFAELYNGDALLASRIIAISTVLSIVTIPLINLLL